MEECPERLTEAQIRAIIRVVAECFPAAPNVNKDVEREGRLIDGEVLGGERSEDSYSGLVH